MMRCTQRLQLPRGLALVFLTMLTIAAMPAHVSAFVIDDFSDAGMMKTGGGLKRMTAGSATGNDGSGLHGVFGGSRQALLKVQNVHGPAEMCDLAVEPSAGGLVYSSSGRADGALELTYNGGGQGLQADFSSLQGVRIFIDTDASSVPYTVALTLRDSSRHSRTVKQTITRAGAQQIDLLSGASRVVNMRKISQIRILIDPPVAADLVVNRIETLGAGAKGRRR